jgi:hypothetical protein
LVIGYVVHENVVIAIFVQELHVTLVKNCLFNFDASIERALQHVPGAQVAQLCAHECSTLTWLYVLKFDNCVQRVIDVEGNSVF